MSVQVIVKGFTGKEVPEFQKHFESVQFCIERELSFPKETVEFFKGKIEEEDLESFNRKDLLDKIRYGFDVKIPQHYNKSIGQIWINTKDIPSYVSELCIKLI